jgi:hypothetical protein
MITVESIIYDIVTSLLMLGLILGFHVLTERMFVHLLDFSSYEFHWLGQLLDHPIVIVVYLIPIAIHLLLGGGCIFVRGLLNENFKFLEVLIIAIMPVLIYFVYDCGGYLMRLLTNPRQTPKTTEYMFSYDISVTKELIDIFITYFFNALILFLGGYTGWLILKNFGR